MQYRIYIPVKILQARENIPTYNEQVNTFLREPILGLSCVDFKRIHYEGHTIVFVIHSKKFVKF